MGRAWAVTRIARVLPWSLMSNGSMRGVEMVDGEW